MDILIDELDGSLWVASVDKGRMETLEVDPASEEVRYGAIYWAKVERIDSALDAAFINLDGDVQAILHNADVRFADAKGKVIKGGDMAIGKYLGEGQMIAVQAKSGYVSAADDFILPSEVKLPRVSMDVTIPGRHLIFAPFIRENRLSSRIKDKKMRKMILKMMESVEDMDRCILRASAANTQTDVLRREALILKALWEKVIVHFTGDEPALIMDGPNAVERSLGDHAGQSIERIDVTTMDRFAEVEEWCEVYAPDLVPKIKPVELPDQNADLGLFDFRDIVDQMEALFAPYTILTHGANIILQETAALVAIDVNRGADRRGNLAINIDAAHEAMRQVRLRNLGGIVLIDFLKMNGGKAEKQQLLDALVRAAEADPCTVQIHGFTGLGLVEITRKQRTPPLLLRMDSALEE